MCNCRGVEVKPAGRLKGAEAAEAPTWETGKTAPTGIATAIGRGPQTKGRVMRKASLQSREGGASAPSVRRASTERNPCSPPAAWIPMRGAGGPQTVGVLPGSEGRAVRRRAPAPELHPRLFTARRGLPALLGIASHPYGPAREAGQEESHQ